MLKKYQDQSLHTTQEDEYIPSGIQSPNTEAEMMIVLPLQEHPELKGLYKAIDPTDGWTGWVEYQRPVLEAPEEPTNYVV